MKKVFTIFLILSTIGFTQAQQNDVKSKDATTFKPDAGPQLIPAENNGEEGATPKVNPNAAKIVFKEDSYNFGEVAEGPQVTHEFKFKNEGKEPLILSNVHASCGCTTPSWPKEPVLPGKEATILVTYNTQGRPGAFSKTITIASNADLPNKIIDIKGEVIKAEPEKSVPVEQPSMLSPKN